MDLYDDVFLINDSLAFKIVSLCNVVNVLEFYQPLDKWVVKQTNHAFSNIRPAKISEGLSV